MKIGAWRGCSTSTSEILP